MDSVINDDNYKDFIIPELCGRVEHTGPIPYAVDAPITLIPEKDWRPLIRARKYSNYQKFHDFGLKIKNQQQTLLCWNFASASNFEFARGFAGLPHVSLSPASSAALITGWRMRGGWGGEAIKQYTEQGLVPSAMWPDTGWTKNLDNTETKAIRQNFRAEETWRLTSWQQIVSALLLGFTVSAGFNWWGHQVLLLDVVERNGALGIVYANSWGTGFGDKGFGVLTGSRMYPNDAVCIRTVTTYAETTYNNRNIVLSV